MTHLTLKCRASPNTTNDSESITYNFRISSHLKHAKKKNMISFVNSAQLFCCLQALKKKGPHDDSAIFKLNLIVQKIYKERHISDCAYVKCCL